MYIKTFKAKSIQIKHSKGKLWEEIRCQWNNHEKLNEEDI